MAYTDIIQLALVFFSLVSSHVSGFRMYSIYMKRAHFLVHLFCQLLCIPYLLTNPVSVSIAETAYKKAFQEPWLGTLKKGDIGNWLDEFFMIVS